MIGIFGSYANNDIVGRIEDLEEDLKALPVNVAVVQKNFQFLKKHSQPFKPHLVKMRIR